MRIANRIPKIIGRVIAFASVVNLLGYIFKPFNGAAYKIHSLTLIYINSTAFSTALISSILLIVLSSGLSKRKKRAWNLAVAVLSIAIIAEVLRYRIHLPQISIELLMLVLLLVFRKQFYAKSDPTTNRHPLFGLAIALSLSLTIGIALLFFRHSDAIVGTPSFIDLVRTVLNGMVGIHGPVQFKSDRVTDTIQTTLLIFGIATAVVSIWFFFKKIAPLNQITIDEAAKVKAIVLDYPQSDSLSYFSTRLDKSIVWSDSKSAGQSYRVENGVLLVSGDPFGHHSQWSEIIDKLVALSEEYAWTLAVMGCSERAGELWLKKTGMNALHFGDEAVIVTRNFTTEGSQMKNVREMMNKTKRLGYAVEVKRVTELMESERELLKVKSVEWRYGVKERGFAMALDRFLDDLDDQELYALARKNEELMAFMTFSPWGRNSISLDRMLRSREADTGVNELIIAEVTEYSKVNNIERISLNFAAFRSIFEEAERISAGPILRLKRNILRFFSKWIQVETLYRFNAKFQPEWNPRYLIYPGPTKLIEIGVAVGKAEGLL